MIVSRPIKKKCNLQFSISSNKEAQTLSCPSQSYMLSSTSQSQPPQTINNYQQKINLMKRGDVSTLSNYCYDSLEPYYKATSSNSLQQQLQGLGRVFLQLSKLKKVEKNRNLLKQLSEIQNSLLQFERQVLLNQ